MAQRRALGAAWVLQRGHSDELHPPVCVRVYVGWGVAREAGGLLCGQGRAVEGLPAARAASEAIGNDHDSLAGGLGRSSTAGMGVRRRGM